MKNILTILFTFFYLLSFGQRLYYFDNESLSLLPPSYQNYEILEIPPLDFINIYAITSTGEPNLNPFISGTIYVYLYVDYVGGNTSALCRISRIRESDGFTLEYLETTTVTISAGVLTFSFNDVIWSAGDLTDRFRVDINFINDSNDTNEVFYRTGGIYSNYSRVVTPFSPHIRRIFNIN